VAAKEIAVKKYVVTLSAEERERLEMLIRSGKHPARKLYRAVELLRQFGQRLLTLKGGQGHLRLESRSVIPAGSFGHVVSCPAAIIAAFRQKLHLSLCADFPGHLEYQSA
jgi:hypothetical protein